MKLTGKRDGTFLVVGIVVFVIAVIWYYKTKGTMTAHTTSTGIPGALYS